MTDSEEAYNLTNDSYGRWLRASRPPFSWFLSQTEDVQEQLALLGDSYATELCLSIGYAVRNPQAAEASTAAVAAPGGATDAEVDLVQQLAATAVQRLLGRARTPEAAPPTPQRETMGGIGQRRQQTIARRQADAAGRFMGRAPDAVPEVAK